MDLLSSSVARLIVAETQYYGFRDMGSVGKLLLMTNTFLKQMCKITLDKVGHS